MRMVIFQSIFLFCSDSITTQTQTLSPPDKCSNMSILLLPRHVKMVQQPPPNPLNNIHYRICDISVWLRSIIQQRIIFSSWVTNRGRWKTQEIIELISKSRKLFYFSFFSVFVVLFGRGPLKMSFSSSIIGWENISYMILHISATQIMEFDPSLSFNRIFNRMFWIIIHK